MKKKIQHVLTFFEKESIIKNKLILVNSSFSSKILKNVLPNCSSIYCCDGAANHLYQYSINILPDIIIGDFDSINERIMDYYQKKGVKFVKSMSQEKSDFEKIFDYLKEEEEEKENKNIPIVYGGNTSTRIDHEMNQYNVLLKNIELNPVYFTDYSVIRFLKPELKHEIIISEFESHQGIGIVPLISECSVKTKGLRWDVNHKLGFGGVISSSNEIDESSKYVEIESDGVLMFITKIKEKIFDL